MASWRPRVSVVIPVLDEERYLRRCLASVTAQTYPRKLIEVIVADGGSSDGTRDIVRAVASDDPRIRLIDNPRRTQAAGLNVAIAASSGEVIARLDGHAAWSPQHIERFRLHPKPGIQVHLSQVAEQQRIVRQFGQPALERARRLFDPPRL